MSEPEPTPRPSDDAVATEESAPDEHGVIRVHRVRRACLRCGGPPHGYAGCPEYNANLD